MSQPTGPQGNEGQQHDRDQNMAPQQGGGQFQNNQNFGGYPQQGHQGQQWGQQGYAPSAYSAPQPGYGQPQFAQSEPSAFGALFSTNFAQRFTAPLAKLVMLLGIIAAGIFAGYGLFEFITLLTSGYEPGAMAIITAIIHLAFRLSLAFVLLGLLRVVLEYFVNEEKGSSANK